MNKKIAMTLAETLLVLVIMGTIATMVIQTVRTVNVKKDRARFLKTFHAIEAASSDIITDFTKYDQDINATGHRFLNENPLSTATTIFPGVSLNRGNAFCYFLAEKLNTTFVECEHDQNLNIRTVDGVCIGYAQPFTGDNLDIVINPGCDGDSEHKYLIRVSKYGKISVPQSKSGTAGNTVSDQSHGYARAWIKHQTDMGKNIE